MESRLRILRNSVGMSTRALSAESGVALCMINKYENTPNPNPKLHAARRLARALDCDVNSIFPDLEKER